MLDTMVMVEKESFTFLKELVRKFGSGQLSYDELWAEILLTFLTNDGDGSIPEDSI